MRQVHEHSVYVEKVCGTDEYSTEKINDSLKTPQPATEIFVSNHYKRDKNRFILEILTFGQVIVGPLAVNGDKLAEASFARKNVLSIFRRSAVKFTCEFHMKVEHTHANAH